MPFNHIILAFLWIVYCLLHSLFASIPVKERIRRAFGESGRYYRLAYTVFAFLTLVAVLLYQVMLPRIELFPTNATIRVAGLIVGFAGLTLMLVCIKNYFLSLSGLLSLFRERTAPRLIIKGVHKYIRHPLYLGTFGFIWGLFLIFPYLSLFICNAIVTIYTVLAIYLEEKKLVLEFGDEYRKYQRQVPKLIPFPRLWRD
jgi:methanethiol S-methyltransferase